jgi:hypothetical protein
MENAVAHARASMAETDDLDELLTSVNIYPADSGPPMTVWVGPRREARCGNRRTGRQHSNSTAQADRTAVGR